MARATAEAIRQRRAMRPHFITPKPRKETAAHRSPADTPTRATREIHFASTRREPAVAARRLQTTPTKHFSIGTLVVQAI